MPGTGHGDGHGYADEPLRKYVRDDTPEIRERVRDATTLRDEPECVDSDAIATYAEVGRRNDAIRAAAEVEQLREVRRYLSVDQRILDVQWRAKRARIDTTSEVFFIRKALERHRADNAMKRLVALEDRIDHTKAIKASL